MTVVGRDSSFLMSTLQELRTSGYFVCSRPLNSTTGHIHESSDRKEERMAAISEAMAMETTRSESISIDPESGIGRSEIRSSSAPKISSLRKKFEAFPVPMEESKVKLNTNFTFSAFMF